MLRILLVGACVAARLHEAVDEASDHVTCPAAAESQYVRRLGDGVCDVALNTEGCGWDLKSHAIFFRKTCYNTPHPEDESERGAVLTEPGHGSRREGGSVWRA